MTTFEWATRTLFSGIVSNVRPPQSPITTVWCITTIFITWKVTLNAPRRIAPSQRWPNAKCKDTTCTLISTMCAIFRVVAKVSNTRDTLSYTNEFTRERSHTFAVLWDATNHLPDRTYCSTMSGHTVAWNRTVASGKAASMVPPSEAMWSHTSDRCTLICHDWYVTRIDSTLSMTEIPEITLKSFPSCWCDLSSLQTPNLIIISLYILLLYQS